MHLRDQHVLVTGGSSGIGLALAARAAAAGARVRTARPGYFEEVPVAVFERTMAVNYFGTLYPLKAVVPAMVKRGKGAVVLISSGAGLMGLFGYTPYSPTKFALRGLAESLRAELKPTGVHVMIVYPPDTDTPQLAARAFLVLL
jgi:3-dehydrosphinganine reductase